MTFPFSISLAVDVGGTITVQFRDRGKPGHPIVIEAPLSPDEARQLRTMLDRAIMMVESVGRT